MFYSTKNYYLTCTRCGGLAAVSGALLLEYGQIGHTTCHRCGNNVPYAFDKLQEIKSPHEEAQRRAAELRGPDLLSVDEQSYDLSP